MEFFYLVSGFSGEGRKVEIFFIVFVREEIFFFDKAKGCG